MTLTLLCGRTNAWLQNAMQSPQMDGVLSDLRTITIRMPDISSAKWLHCRFSASLGTFFDLQILPDGAHRTDGTERKSARAHPQESDAIRHVLSKGRGKKCMSNSAKVDQKGRLKIPQTLLTAFQGRGTEFYITSEDGESIRIYPMSVWNQVDERLERLCSHKRNTQKLLVRAKYFGRAVTMDKQGRVLIPVVLRSSAQMKGVVDYLITFNI
jgi:MraZ protein